MNTAGNGSENLLKHVLGLVELSTKKEERQVPTL